MAYNLTEERWDAIKAYLNKVWAEPDKYPDRGLLLSLSDEEAAQLFTRKRLGLVRLIREKNPKNATELSRLAGRRLSAVMRDLGLLERFHIVGLNKTGKNVAPVLKKEILILPLVKLRAREISELRATA